MKKIILINLFLLIVAILIVDNVLTISSKDPGYQFGFTVRHGSNMNVKNQLPSQYYKKISNHSLYKEPITFRTGPLGDVLPRGGNGDKKVFFIGGSTTESHWMPEDSRWPYLVGEHPLMKERVKTYNFGVGGYNSHQNLLKYMMVLNKEKPDIIVLNHLVNDLAKSLNGGYYGLEGSLHNSYETRLNKQTMTDRIKTVIGMLFPTINQKWRIFRNSREIATKRSESKLSIEQRHDFLKDALKAFKARLILFHTTAEATGAIFVLINQANRTEALFLDPSNQSPAKTHLQDLILQKNMTETDYLFFLNQYTAALKQFAEEHDVPLIDLDNDLKKSDQTMYDSIHYSPEGSKQVAVIVAKHLQRLILQRN